MCTEHSCGQCKELVGVINAHPHDIYFKTLAGKLNSETELKRLLIHYTIQGTLDVYTSMINNGEWEAKWTSSEDFADSVIETFSEYEFGDDRQAIADVIGTQYQKEFETINNLAESNQQPKSWPYLIRYEKYKR